MYNTITETLFSKEILDISFLSLHTIYLKLEKVLEDDVRKNLTNDKKEKK